MADYWGYLAILSSEPPNPEACARVVEARKYLCISYTAGLKSD